MTEDQYTTLASGSDAQSIITNMRNRVTVQLSLNALITSIQFLRVAVERYAELHLGETSGVTQNDIAAQPDRARDASFVTIEASLGQMLANANIFLEHLQAAAPSLSKQPPL